MLTKKLMLFLACGTMLSAPLVEATVTNSVAEQSIEIGCFKSDRERFMDSYEYNHRQMEIRKELERQEQERLRLEEEERKRQEELERQRAEEERQRQIEANRMYVKFEVSFYTTAADEGGHLGACGDELIPWVSIATPKDIPFYSNVHIEGLGDFTVHDTGSYIKWATDNEGNRVCRVDVCVNSKSEAYKLGRYYAYGYIDLNR